MESPDLKERDMPVAGGGRSAQVRERICLFFKAVLKSGKRCEILQQLRRKGVGAWQGR